MEIKDSDYKWYPVLVYRASKSVQNFKKQLEILDIKDDLKEIFVPMIKLTIPTSKGMKEKSTAKFEEYAFLHMRLSDLMYSAIKNSNGIKFVYPINPLTTEEIENIKREKPPKEITNEIDELELEDKVMIMDGALKDMEGYVTGSSERGEIEVEIPLFSASKVFLHPSMLKKLPK